MNNYILNKERDIANSEIADLKDKLAKEGDFSAMVTKKLNIAEDKLSRRNMQIKDLKAQVERLGRAKDIEVDPNNSPHI